MKCFFKQVGEQQKQQFFKLTETEHKINNIDWKNPLVDFKHIFPVLIHFDLKSLFWCLQWDYVQSLKRLQPKFTQMFYLFHTLNDAGNEGDSKFHLFWDKSLRKEITTGKVSK